MPARSGAGRRRRLEHGSAGRPASSRLGSDPRRQSGRDRGGNAPQPSAAGPVLLYRWLGLAASGARRPVAGLRSLAAARLSPSAPPARRDRVRSRPSARSWRWDGPEPARPAAGAVRVGPGRRRRIDAAGVPHGLRPARLDHRVAGRARAPDRRARPVGASDRAPQRDRLREHQGYRRAGAGARRRAGRAARRDRARGRSDRRACRFAAAVRRADPVRQHRRAAARQRCRARPQRLRGGRAPRRRILGGRRRPAAPATAKARAAGRNCRSGSFSRGYFPRRRGRRAPEVPCPGSSGAAGCRRRGLPGRDGGRPTGDLPRSRRASPAGHGSDRHQAAGGHARAGGT